MADIERVLTQFGGAFGGAAGPIRAVAARTCDVLPTAAEIAEILHPGLDLAERVSRLLVRLDLGIAGAAVDLARQARGQLSRSDYGRLVAARLVSSTDIQTADDAAILGCVDDDKAKLIIVRDAAEAISEQERRRAAPKAPPILEPYEA
jgi:helicase